jgi:hypothetical protein
VPEHRAAQLVSRTIIWQIVATAALIGAVVLLQLQQAAAQRSARVEQTTQLREGCARSVAQDFEAWARIAIWRGSLGTRRRRGARQVTRG